MNTKPSRLQPTEQEFYKSAGWLRSETLHRFAQSIDSLGFSRFYHSLRCVQFYAAVRRLFTDTGFVPLPISSLKLCFQNGKITTTPLAENTTLPNSEIPQRWVSHRESHPSMVLSESRSLYHSSAPTLVLGRTRHERPSQGSATFPKRGPRVFTLIPGVAGRENVFRRSLSPSPYQTTPLSLYVQANKGFKMFKKLHIKLN